MSWWKTPKLTREEARYITSIESIFKVKDASKRWIPYDMQPHQIDFHKGDVALKADKAKSRVVVKSRNTSFTTSACISNLMAVPYYPSQEVPFVRLNEKRAYDLIDDMKEIVRNMQPLNIEGVAYPFDPKDCDMDAAGKIRFPNKVVFQAYPANAVAAENIRGLRIAGSAGMLDECFTRNTEIYVQRNNNIERVEISRVKNSDKVLSYNEKTKELEFKEVAGVLEKPLIQRELIKLSFIKNKYSIECTPEHPFYDEYFNLIEAKDLKIGQTLITNKNSGSVSYNQQQKEILYGIILGDGYLSKPRKKLNSSNLSITHGMKQREYADWVGDLLDLNKRRIYTSERTIGKYTFDTPLYLINGHFSSELLELRNMFYQNGKKIVTSEILDLLTPLSLAFWFMDDGSKSSECYALHTENFTKNENNLICKWFKEKYGIRCKVMEYRGYYRIMFNAESTKQLDALISKYIHPSMQYKLTNRCKHKEFVEIDSFKNKYKLCKILDIRKVVKRARVYNLDVKDNHNFFVGTNRILVHNCNFMDTFNDIYISLRDAASGFTSDGKKHFQINCGTTLKGTVTPFALWFKKQQELQDNDMDILRWEVFDPALFDINKPPIEQPLLVPIVSWHNIIDLNKKYMEDLKTFLEEYMAIMVDSDMQFYPTSLYEKCMNKSLKNIEHPTEAQTPIGKYVMGVDVASVMDFFVITVFNESQREVEVQKADSYGNKIVEKEVQNFYVQKYLFYDRGKDLKEMENILKEKIDLWKPLGLYKVRIDSQGSGLQLYQNIKNIYKKSDPNMIENVPLGNIKKGNDTVKMKEYVHTNQKKLMVYGNVEFILDETQKMHYSMWDYAFECERTKEYGHGDTTIANAYALLPPNYKGKRHISDIMYAFEPKSPSDGEKSPEDMTIKEIVSKYNDLSIKDKFKLYKSHQY